MRAQDPLIVENAVLARIVDDQANGREPVAEAYHQAFPGHAELVDRLLKEWQDPDDERAERFGPFEVVSVLGRGGQGVVYLARDVELPRTVALKVLGMTGLFDTERQLRFRREAEVAARLDHPNLCRVLAYGIEKDAPYLAMQFVPGQSLARVIAGQSGDGAVELTTTSQSSKDGVRVAGVLTVVETLARALHVAHESGVVHRDVKPANVMLTPEGQPVLLDFGLAHDDDSVTETLTMTSDMLGTPAYMAPEQVLGQRTDRRTDVFALAVLLYECLTRSRPFAGATRQKLFDAIRSGEFIAPSKAATGIPSDLDLVLAVALDTDPNRRYETAEAFADDLAHVLAKEPVTARPVGRLVRIQRFLQRNRTLAVSAMLVLTVSVMAAIVATTAWLRSEDARAESVAINDYILKDLLLAAGPRALGRDARIVDSLQQGAKRIEERFADRPALAASVRLQLSRTFGGLGQWRDALDLAQRSLATRERRFGAGDERTNDARYEVAHSHLLLKEYEAAIATFDVALPHAEHIHGKDSEQAMRIRVQLASARAQRDSFKDGFDEFRALYERCRELFGDMAELTRFARAGLGDLLAASGDSRGSLVYVKEAFERNAQHFGPDALETISARLDYAMALVDIRELDAAIEHLTTVLPLLEAAFGEAHPYMVTALGTLGSAYSDGGRIDEAIAYTVQAIELAGKVLGKDHEYTLVSRYNLAIAYRHGGQFDKALAEADALLAAWRRVRGDTDINIAKAHDLKTAVYVTMMAPELAIESGEKALAAAEAAVGPDDMRIGDLVWTLARANEIARRYEPALKLWFRALAFDERANGKDSRWVASDMRRIGFSQYWLRRFAEARDSFDRAIRIQESKEPKNEVDLALLRALRAAASFRMGETNGVVETIEASWQFLADQEQLQRLYYSDVVTAHVEACQQAGSTEVLQRAQARLAKYPKEFGLGFPE